MPSQYTMIISGSISLQRANLGTSTNMSSRTCCACAEAAPTVEQKPTPVLVLPDRVELIELLPHLSYTSIGQDPRTKLFRRVIHLIKVFSRMLGDLKSKVSVLGLFDSVVKELHSLGNLWICRTAKLSILIQQLQWGLSIVAPAIYSELDKTLSIKDVYCTFDLPSNGCSVEKWIGTILCRCFDDFDNSHYLHLNASRSLNSSSPWPILLDTQIDPTVVISFFPNSSQEYISPGVGRILRLDEGDVQSLVSGSFLSPKALEAALFFLHRPEYTHIMSPSWTSRVLPSLINGDKIKK